MIGAEPMFQKLKILIMKNSIFLKINDYLLYIKLIIFIIFFIIIKGY